MKIFCAVVLLAVLVEISNGEELVRKKRFFDSLWPSEVKSDVQSGLIYSQLPVEYLHLLPGVNDHKVMQSRADSQQPSRFVHPTRMAILMQPQQHGIAVVRKPVNVIPKTSNINTNLQHGSKIVMKPTVKHNPSIIPKAKEQPLPDIHRNQRFVPLKPVQSVTNPFNAQQQLPIKKSFDTASATLTDSPHLSIKSAAIEDFYFTQEFQDLLKEFNIRVDFKKLPPICDVMIVLGTETAEETINAINEVAKSPEGMELIKSYLDHMSDKESDDEFYNYEEDVGAGEIKVSESNSIQTQDASHSQQQQFPHNSYILKQPNAPTRATTVGTLTGQRSWWRPTSWFSSSQSTGVESLQNDVEIFKKIVPAPGSPVQNFNYVRNFFTPASRQSIPIESIGNPRRSFVQEPIRFTHPSIAEQTKVLPAVRMTEAQFQNMVKTLGLTPMNMQHLQKAQTPYPSVASAPAAKTFTAPINVQSISSGLSQGSLPLPSTYTKFDQTDSQTTLKLTNKSNEQDNRRSFISASDPQRVAPYDFIATGRIHQANPDEVIKKSRSLSEASDGKAFQIVFRRNLP